MGYACTKYFKYCLKTARSLLKTYITGQGQIPADSTLVFEVELFDWKGEDVSKDSDGSIIKRTLVVGEGDTAKEDALVESK